MPELLAVGRVARAHGLRGRVLIVPYNADSDGLCRVRRLWVGEREFEVDRAERVNLGYLVALRGVADRDQADALRGSEVRVDRADLPALEEDEMYAVDLIGYQVSDPQGTVHGVVEARNPLHLAGHQAARVEEQQHGLVALGPVGADDDLGRAGRRRPVDASALVVDSVFAQGVELGPATLAARRPQPDLEDASPVDAKLGLLPRPEGRVHAQDPRRPPAPLTSGEPEGTLDTHDELGGREPAPPLRPDDGAGAGAAAGSDDQPHPAGRGRERRRQLVGDGDDEAPAARVADPPHDLALRTQVRPYAGEAVTELVS